MGPWLFTGIPLGRGALGREVALKRILSTCDVAGVAELGPAAVLRTYLDNCVMKGTDPEEEAECRSFPRCGPRYKEAHSRSPPGAALGPSPGVRPLHVCCHGYCHWHYDGEPGTFPSLLRTAYPRRVDDGGFSLSLGALGCL